MTLTEETVTQALDVLLQTVDWETTSEKHIKVALREQLGDEVLEHAALIKVRSHYNDVANLCNSDYTRHLHYHTLIA